MDWEDLTRWKNINQMLELGIEDPVETYSSSKHLFEDLGIPAGTKGRIKASSYPGGVRPKTDDRPAGRGGSGHRNGGGNRPRSDAAPKREGGHTKPAHGDGEHKRPTTERTAGDRQRRRTRGGTQ